MQYRARALINSVAFHDQALIEDRHSFDLENKRCLWFNSENDQALIWGTL